MSDSFTYVANPGRVVFGPGTISRLPDEVAILGLSRVMIITTEARAYLGMQASDLLQDKVVLLYPHAMMHTPWDVTETALRALKSHDIDGLVAIGGGSTTGLSKALALQTGLPQIVVATTYAGSEMTPILGETKDGIKKTLVDKEILPEVVIYDVELTLGLPAHISAASGMNAIAHSVEALYAREANPVISLLAKDGIRMLARALPRIVADESDLNARADALYGAWLSGICLGSVGMALHHKLCHTLGGSFNLPHAETHSIVLPHAMAYNANAAPAAERAVAEALGAVSAADGLFDLVQSIGLPTALRDLGMKEEDIGRAVEIALSKPYWNPRPIEAEPITALITKAWRGDRP